MMSTKVRLLAVAVAFLSSVSGHGFVSQVTLGGTVYPGYHPYVDPYLEPIPERIVRKLPGIGPVEDLSLIDVQCNGEASSGYVTEPAPLVGQAASGSLVNITWTSYAADSHRGPLLTYMARAPSDIKKWNPGAEPVWFKVDHRGKDVNGKWAATETFANRGNGTYTFRIPPNLLPGQYLIRHEWIALHLAEKHPGAQLYPACFQVEVTGNGTAFPTDFVSFPGAYRADTPGIIFDVWNDETGKPYPIPGPPVWSGGYDA